MKYVEKGSGYSHSVAYEYDTLNNLTKLTETINGVVHTTTYTYDDDNRVIASTTDGVTVSYTYDGFGRVATQITQNGSTTVLTESYTYTAPTAGTTSAQIATYTTATPNGYSVTYSYTYDDNGNILSVSDGTNTTSYVYDSANQLIRENNQAGSYTHTWEYDNAGNIQNRKEYSYTTGELGTPIDTATYAYSDSNWGDLLTAYDGNNITYDTIGNPLTDGTWTYQWQHGRQLASMTGGDTTWSYTYNADGLRTQRTDGTTTYSYVYNGSQLSLMTVGNDTLKFTYDANGTPLTVTYNETVYYYVTNLQGDITSIVDTAGTTVATYSYDAWGNLLSTTGTMADTLGALNPLRYRGYIYDTETGLYYVSSRYYDPEIGRFTSPDTTDVLTATPMGLTDKNLFAYCDNNPVVRVDYGGQFWESVFDVISLGASIVEVCVNPTDIWAWAGLVGDAVDLIPFVTGVGEVTRAVKTTVKVVDKAADVLDTANTLYKTADAASDIRKATGSYEIVYKSGKNYIGKGNFNRAMTSAKEHAKSVDDILSIRWKSAPSSRDAFIDEYLMQKRFGGVLSGDQELLTYNKIWSPGRRYYGR